MLPKPSIIPRCVSLRILHPWCPLKVNRSFYSTSRILLDLQNSNNNILLYAANSMKEKRKTATEPKRIPKHGGYEKKKGGNLQKKKVPFKFSSGTERAQRAANHVIQQVYKINERGIIKFVDEETNQLVETTILDFAGGIDLEKFGLTIVNLEESRGYQIPLLKVVDVKVALKKHSEEFARQKVDELTKMGISAKRSGKGNENEKSGDNVKHIKVSWQISDSDLARQKANEITSQLKKGFKVHLYIDAKDAFSRANWADKFENLEEQDNQKNKITPKELNRREAVIEQLQGIFEEYALQPNIEGSIKSRMILRLLPKPLNNKQEDKSALRAQRKMEKQEKLQKRLERKRQREETEELADL